MANADISTLEKLRAQVGKEAVVTGWVLVSQERIRFDGAVTLAPALTLTLDTPALLLAPDARVQLSSSLLQWGNTRAPVSSQFDVRPLPLPDAGNGTMQLQRLTLPTESRCTGN